MSRLHLSLLEGEVGDEDDVSCWLDDMGGASSDWVVSVDTKGILFVSNM